MAESQLRPENEEFGTKNRMNIFRFAVIAIIVLYIGRLGFLQIVKGNIYRLESETQAIKQVIVEPFRGNIFDRNGKLLVHNEGSFTLTITKNDFREETIPLLCSILDVDSSDINQILRQYKTESKFIPIKIYRDLDYSKVAMLQEYSDLLPGVDIVIESKRLYDFNGNFSQLLGYNKEISETQLQSKPYYRPGDVIGQTGIEMSYEELLRGNKGIQFVAVNKMGQKVASFDDGKSDVASSNGFDLYLTIDKKLQEIGEQLLEGWRGSIVAMDPNNGEILALVSKPNFDVRKFSGRIPSKLYAQVMTDPASPLLNRPIQSRYAPGSTWKMLMAIAGLQEGVITPNSTFSCPGSFEFGGRVYKCHGAHGALTVEKAIQYSCNVFFYQLALKLGFEKFEKYGRMFGFSEKTNIDLPSERKSFLPTQEWANKVFGKSGMPKGYMVNFGVGQGEVAATPIQMATYCSALANKGTLYQPHVVRYIHNNINFKIEPLETGAVDLPVDKRYFDLIQKGMYDVVNTPGGTGYAVRIPGLNVCGKTGTAQNPQGKDHSWFICYAPKDNPQIAIVVMVENAGFGAAVAAPIAAKMLNAFFFPDMPIFGSKSSNTMSLDTSSTAVKKKNIVD